MHCDKIDNLNLKGNLKHIVIPPKAASNLTQYDPKGKYKKAAKDAHKYCKTAIGTTKDAGKFKTGQPKHKFPKLVHHNKLGEMTVKEISKRTAANYIGKASRDAYFKGRDQGTVDAISAVGGSHPHKDYKKSPESKAAMRMRGIDRATNRLAKKEAMSDAEKAAHQKAIDAFKAKGGKIKKLKPGFAQGYHGKADPGAGMKGMISPADTKQFGTKKKVGSMK